jgi:hypothetical protein
MVIDHGQALSATKTARSAGGAARLPPEGLTSATILEVAG